jgi:hypothetical protein
MPRGHADSQQQENSPLLLLALTLVALSQGRALKKLCVLALLYEYFGQVDNRLSILREHRFQRSKEFVSPEN